MRFFKNKADSERMMTCPSCCQLVPSDATECSMCGADLREIPQSKRDAALSAGQLSGSGSPYSR